MEQYVRRVFSQTGALYLVFGAVLVSFIVSSYIHFHPNQWIDLAFTQEAKEHSYNFLTLIMKLISWPGNPAVGISTVLITAGIFWRMNKLKIAACFLLIIVADVFSYFIKFAINRPRPTMEVISVAGRHISEPGFPSTHVVHYVVYFGFLAFVIMILPRVNDWIRYSVVGGSIAMIAGISLSRIYLGAHWFTDVLAGYLFGSIFLAGVIAIYLHLTGISNNS